MKLDVPHFVPNDEAAHLCNCFVARPAVFKHELVVNIAHDLCEEKSAEFEVDTKEFSNGAKDRKTPVSGDARALEFLHRVAEEA